MIVSYAFAEILSLRRFRNLHHDRECFDHISRKKWPQLLIEARERGNLEHTAANMVNDSKSLRVWDASECVLMFIDYQEHVFDVIFAQDRRVIELNARTLAKMAVSFKIPVILSTVGVELGANGPTIDSLRAVVPNVKDIDRSTMNAWADLKFHAAVKATGRKRLVMCGISTSACLAYPTVSALADGYDVMFIEDAVGDSSQRQHETAVLRLAHAGAVPNTTVGMIAEWFLDWKLPVADAWKKAAGPYYEEIAALQRAPKYQTPQGFSKKSA